MKQLPLLSSLSARHQQSTEIFHEKQQSEFCVLVVAKAPVPGFAKTRLCPPASPEQASEIAACALLDTLETALSTPRARVVVAMTGDLESARRSKEIQQVLSRTTVITQRGKSFAEKLVNAHRDASTLTGGLPVVQIGMDTPQVTTRLLTECAASLIQGKGSALGLANDGGWWILGINDPQLVGILSEIPMSTSDTGRLTLQALSQAGSPPAVMPALSDVDTIADAREVASVVKAGRFSRAVEAILNTEEST